MDLLLFKILPTVYYFLRILINIFIFLGPTNLHYSPPDLLTWRSQNKVYIKIQCIIHMFIDDHINNETAKKISYGTYRNIFNNDFSITFGYPRTDTCNTCDQFKVKLDAVQSEIQSSHWFTSWSTFEETHTQVEYWEKTTHAENKNIMYQETSNTNSCQKFWCCLLCLWEKTLCTYRWAR